MAPENPSFVNYNEYFSSYGKLVLCEVSWQSSFCKYWNN